MIITKNMYNYIFFNNYESFIISRNNAHAAYEQENSKSTLYTVIILVYVMQEIEKLYNYTVCDYNSPQLATTQGLLVFPD